MSFDEMMSLHERCSFCSLEVVIPRSIELLVEADTVDQHRAHAVIYSSSGNGSLSKSAARHLAKKAAMTHVSVDTRRLLEAS